MQLTELAAMTHAGGGRADRAVAWGSGQEGACRSVSISIVRLTEYTSDLRKDIVHSVILALNRGCIERCYGLAEW